MLTAESYLFPMFVKSLLKSSMNNLKVEVVSSAVFVNKTGLGKTSNMWHIIIIT